MISVRVPLLDLKQVKSVTKLVKLKVSFTSDKLLDNSEVGLRVCIFKSPAKINLSYLFKTSLSATEVSSKPQFLRCLEDGKQIKCTTFSWQ